MVTPTLTCTHVQANFTNGERQLRDWQTPQDGPCRWFGITCNDEGRVVGIKEASQLPARWLACLFLSACWHHGAWRAALQIRLPNRVLASASDHHITRWPQAGRQLRGSIPAGGFALPSTLQRLSLSRNLLEGSLPRSWALPANLSTLDLTENNLGGLLPSDWTAPASAAIYVSPQQGAGFCGQVSWTFSACSGYSVAQYVFMHA